MAIIDDIRNIEEWIEFCKETGVKGFQKTTEHGVKMLEVESFENILKYVREQEKIIELMGLDIAKSDFNADICMKMKKDEFWCGSTDEECKNCIIDYFKKKARENNEH